MMAQNLQLGDLVHFAHKDNMFTGSIIADAQTDKYGSRCFRVHTHNVIENGKNKLVQSFCVDYPARALSLIRVNGL